MAIEPSALTRALYLLCHDEDRGGRRTFKVERILSASLTPEVFDEPGAATARELLAAWDVISDQPLERVVIRFSPEVAARVAETTWHPSQVIEEGPDGSITWQARVAGIQEIRAWVLGWGGQAEVLEPPALRERVRDEVRRLPGRTSRTEPGGRR
jgi:CRISPR-associated endonuclease/helicase Cas3